MSVMLLMATSSVTGSSVGARDEASRPVWLSQVCTSAGISTRVISAVCVVAAWELSLVASPGSQLAVYGQSPQLHLDCTCSGETCSNQTTRSAFLSRSERNGVQLKTEICLRMLLACHLVAKPIPVRTHSRRYARTGASTSTTLTALKDVCCVLDHT